MKRQGFIETIQQPDLQATNNRRWELTMNQQETILKIEGMMCEHCVKSVTKALTKTQSKLTLHRKQQPYLPTQTYRYRH